MPGYEGASNNESARPTSLDGAFLLTRPTSETSFFSFLCRNRIHVSSQFTIHIVYIIYLNPIWDPTTLQHAMTTAHCSGLAYWAPRVAPHWWCSRWDCAPGLLTAWVYSYWGWMGMMLRRLQYHLEIAKCDQHSLENDKASRMVYHGLYSIHVLY